MSEPTGILIWTESYEKRFREPVDWTDVCDWCGSQLTVRSEDPKPLAWGKVTILPWGEGAVDCPLCGWGAAISQDVPWNPDIWLYFTDTLKQFAINDVAVPLEVLGSHLKRRYRDVYSLSWRRFEELVADVFRAHGYSVALTQASRDGGADIILLKNDTAERSAIVEAKRYAEQRRVGIGAVRTLVGAAIDWDVRKAYLVTSTEFSRPARDQAESYREKGFDLDLVSASELLSLLEVYNRRLPLLQDLTENKRDEIRQANLSMRG